MNWYAVIIGVAAGVISGMGIGGGTVLIPSLTFFLDVAQKQAQATNLIYFVPTAMSALIVHFKKKQVVFKTALWIIGFGVIGAAGGSLVAIYIKAKILRIIFAVFLCGIGLMEIFKKTK